MKLTKTQVFKLINRVKEAAFKKGNIQEVQEKSLLDSATKVSQKIFGNDLIKNKQLDFGQFQIGYKLAMNKIIDENAKKIALLNAQMTGNESFLKGFSEAMKTGKPNISI